tara:strand:- start:50 stop:685 length:636 start_codon:yes stop_codon:yes gene_type:complete
MKKTKFDLTAVKKKLNLDRLFIAFEHWELGDPFVNSFDAILESSTKKTRDDFPVNDESPAEEDYWEYQDDMRKKFYSDISEKTNKLISKDIWNGQILEKINKNFKRKYHFVFDNQSHVLISSKKNKKFYFFSCVKKEDHIHHFYLDSIFSKIISKKKMFELIMDVNKSRKDSYMEENKDLSYEQREQLWEDTAYISPTGTNYLKLYKKNKL